MTYWKKITIIQTIGTEFFDAKTQSYVDFPITDVLQMMGRAGRPQFDNEGKVCSNAIFRLSFFFLFTVWTI